MRLPRLFVRNRRWIRQVDAYVDERLTPIERELLEERVAESSHVRSVLEETQNLKHSFSQLPKHPAPRSFALTEAMVAEPKARPAPRAVAVTMRMAQATTFAAVAGLAITFGLHIANVGQSDVDDAPLPTSGVAELTGTDAADDDVFRTTSGAADPPAADAEGAPQAEPAMDGDAVSDDADADELVAPDAAPVSDGELRAEPSTPQSESRDYLPVYAGLTAVVVLAAGAWMATRRHLQIAD
jgi:hypothetical protein